MMIHMNKKHLSVSAAALRLDHDDQAFLVTLRHKLWLLDFPQP